MREFDFIERLITRLEGALPGAQAQYLMKAYANHSDFEKPILNSLPKESAVMIMLYQKEAVKEWYLPVIQRPEYDGIHSGQISFPGGKKELADKTLIATALRETEEEIGISGSTIRVLGSLTSLHIEASNHSVLPVVGFFNKKPTFFPDNKEVLEVIELPLSSLLDSVNIKKRNIKIRNVELTVPYFDIDKRFIWGATAMILSELITLIKNT
jgi:8-oxo-dGTP pyrophosphatase MutT (NUDIX family)